MLAHTIGSCAGFLVLIALAFLAGRWTPAGSITHQHVGGSTAPADADELQGATLAGRQQLTTPPKQPQPQRGQRQQQRKRLRAFVGIFSSFTVHGRNSTGYFYKASKNKQGGLGLAGGMTRDIHIVDQWWQ